MILSGFFGFPGNRKTEANHLKEFKMTDVINYDRIVSNAMRMAIKNILKKFKTLSPQSNHHFVISFLTKHPDVSISKDLLEKYPEEITIVLQHQFKNLEIEARRLSVSVSFSGKYENLVIPYQAITSFKDPSVNFVLRFASEESLEDEFDWDEEDEEKEKIGTKEGKIDPTQKVIFLSDFKKNNDKNDK